MQYFHKNHQVINSNQKFLKNELIEFYFGEPIVHLEHGIGRYAGMITLEVRGIISEYVILNYANDDKLYIPISSLHLVNHYIGNNVETAPLHKLGGNTWLQLRKKKEKRVRDIAAELLDSYSQRKEKIGFAFKLNNKKYCLFCNDFPFKTTPDQIKSINDVLSDMTEPKAMDRLVCGDAGFGKTEVAMRAAFLAVENKKQVAVLVPTTLLAKQHFDNFRNRFTNWPTKIAMLSSFLCESEQLNIIKEISKGSIDIVVGTHKLLQKSMKWKDLGLLIIDEEHRFGVDHKERIKMMYSEIDVLSLTATPIPRTLKIAMIGVRDLSIISTPPVRRLSVKTIICEHDDFIIRKAILFEIFRDGQVYYICNDVINIQRTADRLSKLIPEATVMIAHGQMRKQDLEKVMNNFRSHQFNVLVCTTIIDTGIDVPKANTIIIEHANHFGLSQLHQLRGRVGRSHHQAYAWFLISDPKTITPNAQKRLEAIDSLKELGSGFILAKHDLEIRGAGEFLGEEQSGSIETIEFSLYMELLEFAVDSLKNQKKFSLRDFINQQVEVELRIPSILPNDYIPDVNVRLFFYKRIAHAKTDDDLKNIKIELINRFGLLPDFACNLLEITALRQKIKKLGIRKLESNEKGGFIEFTEKNKIDYIWLITLLKEHPKNFSLDGSTKLRFNQDLSDPKKRICWIRSFIHQIEENTTF